MKYLIFNSSFNNYSYRSCNYGSITQNNKIKGVANGKN